MSVESAAESALPSGLPCWVELAYASESAVQHFYGELFGWQLQPRADPATADGRYSIASLDGFAVGGQYRAAPGQPPGWTLHLSVRHPDLAEEWVTHLGGRITLGPVEIPGRGTILHVLDPSGAPVVLWAPTEQWQFATGRANTFTGADLNTHDSAVTDQFFCRLFQYSSQQIGDAEIDYAEWRLEQQPVLYRYRMGPEYRPETPPHWLVYFEVDPGRGTDATAGHALMLGGSVVIEPYDTFFGRTAILADPDGAVFAVIDHSQVSRPGRAEVDDPNDD